MELTVACMATTGECFCGAVSYAICGVLGDARSCHCSRCRKAFSAQASAHAVVDANDFKWLTGEHLLTSYVGEHGFGLQFCKVCGSTLCTVHNSVVHGITLGSLNGDPQVTLGMHIYVAPGVPQYEKDPPQSTEPC
jgi:hypothetical protein